MRLQSVLGAAVWALSQTVSCRAVSSSSAADLVEHETTPALPAGWAYHAPARDDDTLQLRIALAHPHDADHLRLASAVSDPASASYGQYLSAAELQAVLPDVSAAAATVIEWLKRADGVQSVSQQGEWIRFTTTVGAARSLLAASFAQYSFNGEAAVLRTQSYSVPAPLQDAIDFVFPATQFLADGGSRRYQQYSSNSLERRQHSLPGPPDCSVDVCPSKLVTKYNIDYFPPDASSGSTIAIAGFLEQHPNRTDLQSFLHTYGLNNYTATYDTALVNGGIAPDVPADTGAEAMLDLEYALAFTGPLPATYISTGGRPPQLLQPGNVTVPASKSNNEPYLEFLNYLLALDAPPHVISISYSDDEQTVPPAYAARTCDLFARLALRGVSVIDASGDGGALGTGSAECVNSRGETKFVPAFPATCPWVTSVGASSAWGGPATWSAGGFSDYFARPDWQDTAVAGYVERLNGSHAPYYNAAGRAFPDVSLIGVDYVTTVGGFTSTQKGTSASTPVFAAMVALLNDLRLRAGKPVLGFLNPLLYSDALKDVYRDVADGQGAGCANATWFEPGWEALPGWDATTGLGEPDFAKMRAAVV
ncbi:tripeptidyl peptidase precursor [Diplodia corticola]|uniref:tripeptidyl-peptidase II n=1 Tax=Diplodia corticola TaxID=236234 RepID=A0A1J9SK20_9PEZI|nr:tripeptidyl peptidase precursor [Diplodia corticola]OJD39949.1 tripeptidyl peptidase precursor [Diplodia corticola]